MSYSLATGFAGKHVPSGVIGTCAIRLIDRRTGLTHRVNGQPVVVFSRDPEEAAAVLLAGRDPQNWVTHIEPILTEGRIALDSRLTSRGALK